MSDTQTPEPRALRSSVRNPRRRPRQSDPDSLKTAPRRKRSKLNEDTFAPPRTQEEEVVNGSIEVAPAMNGDNVRQPSTSRLREVSREESVHHHEKEIPTRLKKSSVKRSTRGDGATVLTQNERYSVKLLPSTPKELRRADVEYRGSLGAAHHALAVTRERAYIWDYTSHVPVSSPRTFDIPFPVRSTDALPLGALVAAGNSTDIGLVLVSATTGKVVYYDSIERAASLSLFQERKSGVEGSLGSLFSGEAVTEIVSADHAGFIIVLSSGRLVHLTLRDAQGKARVFAQFLRATEHGSGGFFGSIRGMITGGSWRRDVSAVHTRSLGPRGPMQAISLTERAELQMWNLGWAGQYNFNGTIDCREVILEELRKLGSPESGGQAEGMTMLDFALMERQSNGKEAATPGAEKPIEMVVLVQNGTSDNCSYVLAELSIAAIRATVSRTVELESYRQRAGHDASSKPRLFVPRPQHTAFVTFGDAILVAELEGPDLDGPEAQLHASYVETVFEDTIYLKQSPRFEILGAAEEDGTHRASSIAFVQGAGLVRTSVAEPSSVPRMATVPVRNRIEQAVFRDALQDGNIIDFSRVSDARYSPDEVEHAALRISDEILSSTSSFVSTNPTSIETQLAYKAQGLRALVNHVRRNYPALSNAIFWQLLWDAEKVAAAQQMWAAFEKHKAANSEKKHKRAATLMDEVCALAEQGLARGSDVPSTDDVVRDFFVHRLRYVERLLFHAYDFLKQLQAETDYAPQAKMGILLEANDLWNEALEGVFQFRMDNAAAYGILPESLRDGILTDATEYAELPGSWTSSEIMLKASVAMCKISRALANDEYEKNEQDPEMTRLVPEVGKEIPRLLQLMCLIYQERINWLASRPDEKNRELAQKLRANYDDTRYDQFRGLADLAQAEAGMKLAEKHHDMNTLTEMIVAETQFSLEAMQENASDNTAIMQHMDAMTARIGAYFDRFGDDWANAYFDQVFSSGHAGPMFNDAQEHWQEPLTRYLRAEPSRAKLCWINDVLADKDYVHASEVLLDTAMKQESQIWHKKVELSMSKLALLAMQEGLEADGVGMTQHDLNSSMPDKELELVMVQNELYEHLRPEIQIAVDEQGALEITIQRVGLRNQDLHSLKSLLQSGLDRVLKQSVLPVEELIDVLTLMESIFQEDPEEHNLEGAEFFLALRALNAAAPNMSQERVEMLMQLIWKRCYIYDDWVDINSTLKQSGDETEEKLKNTTPWRTIYYALDADFFNQPDCYVRHLTPSECIGAACAREDLEYRWGDSDVLDAIIADNKIQDEQLQGYIEDRRLDEWVEACVASARGAVDDAAEEKAEALREEREFSESLWVKGRNGGANGHAKGAEIKVEDEEEYDGVEGDEDVEMG
ncbi:uncharacterized protein LTR77_004541 [Saxophila tyrrhenica]|uniref:Nuclear pore complex protein Nup133 n=1 Tax=Saxophila tyrrhenica TaxID=1690608 RepID=A0AAV9PFZ0_9PEZI|nr:hypothetical protein LTR77_004541 [Saxophila tyrrhenica]